MSEVQEQCEKRQARGGWAEDAALHRCSWPIGPRNTYSNLAYVLVGLVVYARIESSAALAFYFAMTVLAIGSGLYHGHKTPWANRLDWVGMYMVFGALVVHAIVPLSTIAPWIMLAFGAGIAWYYTYELNGVALNAQMGAFLFLSLLPAAFGPTPHYTLAGSAFAAFAWAFLLWQLDVRKSPLVGLWGHAAWHVFTALALGLTFLSQIA